MQSPEAPTHEQLMLHMGVADMVNLVAQVFFGCALIFNVHRQMPIG